MLSAEHKRPSRGLSFEECSIYKYPHAFVDKHKDPKLVMPLTPDKFEMVKTMYCTEIPRNSFNGLPPAQDRAFADWLDYIREKGIHLVAVSFDKGVVGHSVLFLMDHRKCEILVIVSPAFRGRGIGTELTRCAIEMAYEACIEKIWLLVVAQNYVARHIYVKCGFEYLSAGPSDDLDMMLDLQRYRRTMSVTIGSIINRNVISIRDDAFCKEAIDRFLKNPIGALPVVDDRNRVVGILSETDLIVETNFNQRVSDIMTKQVITVRENYSIARVVRLFRFKKLRCFPAINGHGELVGVISRKDILEFFSTIAWKVPSGGTAMRTTTLKIKEA